MHLQIFQVSVLYYAFCSCLINPLLPLVIFSYWALDKDHNSLLLNSANMVMRRSSHLLAILLKLAAILSNGEVMCSLVLTEQETINKCVFGCAVNAFPRPGG